MSKANRRKIITIETMQRTVIHQNPIQPSKIWCEFCQSEVEMLVPELAAIFSDVSVREIFRRIERGNLHFIERDSNEIFICKQSL